MKVLVTGGAGFIGSHVVDCYLKEGLEVVVVDNLSTGKIENLNPAANFYKTDILSQEMEDIFRRERPEVISHFAAQISVSSSVRDPLTDLEINIKGSLKLLEDSVRYKVKKFIFASTGGALYGELDYLPADENHPVRPLSPYAISKYSVEKYLYYYYKVYGLSYLSLRYSNVYGPRQDPHGEAGVVAIFAKKMLKGGQPVINGDGEQTRDYIYVSDVVRANLLALKSERIGEYNIATGRETTVNQIFRLLKKLTGSRVPEVHGDALKGEVRRSVLSWVKAEKELSFRPEVSLEEGLKETVAFFKNEIE